MKKIITMCLSALLILTLATCAGNQAPHGNSSSEPSPISESGEPSAVSPSAPAESENNSPAALVDSEDEPEEQADSKTSNILVAYFSCTGNTRTLAEYAADALSADLYEIQPEIPYTSADLNYSDNASRSSREMNDSASRPAISGAVENMEEYDIVFLGYPIWWGEAPRIISTFLESYDFSGKTIIPFCTSGSSGIGSSAINLQSLCAESAIWLPGTRLASSASKNDVATWLDGLNIE